MIFPIVVILIIILWITRTVNEKQANARYKQRAIDEGKDFYIDNRGCKYWVGSDLPFEFVTGKDGDRYEVNPFNMAVRRNITQESRDYYAKYALKYAEENDLRFYPFETIEEDHMDEFTKSSLDLDAVCGYRFKDRFSDNIYVQREFVVHVCKGGKYHVGLKTISIKVIFWFNIKTKIFDYIDKNCLKDIDIEKVNAERHIDFTIEDYEESIENEFIKKNEEQKEYINQKETDYFKHNGTRLNWNFNTANPMNRIHCQYPFPIPAVKYTIKPPVRKV